MRPIKLKIKGLNSFIEEQTIDFEELTDRGLFGIFGPTGSGKSTILDGITLALYGKIARESTNYINSNCDSTSVSFEFQVSGAQCKKYLVQREFKTDKSSGNPRSGKCKVVDITNDEAIIIADSVSDVTNVCREIIGLTFEDFTRTVVLPQGKFSEFLKLKGLDRNKMLERLFNLQQYGDELVRKLSREINKEKTNSNYLNGELNGYENISDDILKDKENELISTATKLKESEIEFKKTEKEHLESQEVWKLQVELKSHKDFEALLKHEESSIMLDKEKIKFAEAAEKVYPYVASLEKILEDIKLSEEQLDKLKANLEISKLNKENAEEKYILARSKKDSELQNLKLKEQKVIDALEENKLLEKINFEIIQNQNSISNLTQERIEKESSIKNLDKKLEELKQIISSSEEKHDSLKVDNTLKVKVQEGMILESKIQDLSSIVNNFKAKKKSIEIEIARGNELTNNLTNSLALKASDLKKAEDSLVDLIKSCPGEQDDLLALQKKLTQSSDKWSKYNEYLKVISESNKYSNDFNNKIHINTTAKSNLDILIAKLKKDFKEIQVENLAYQLRGSLENCAYCPVCGSTNHDLENIKNLEIKDCDILENEIIAKEKELKFIEVNITKAETNIAVIENKIAEAEEGIKSLGSEFINIPLESIEESFNNLKLALKDYTNEKQSLEKEILGLKDENSLVNENLNIQKNLLKQNNKQLIEIEKDLNKNMSNLEGLNSKFEVLLSETGITNFNEKSNEISLSEKASEELVISIKKFRKEIDENNSKTKKLDNELSKIREKIATENTTIEQKRKNRDDKVESIKSKVGDVDDIQQLLLSITDTIKIIEDNFTNCERLKESTEKKYRLFSEKFIEVSTKNNDLINRRIEESENLVVILAENNFNSIEHVKNNRINKVDIDIIKDKIDKYIEELTKTLGAIEEVNKKINNRVLDEEQWIKIQEDINLKGNEIKEINETKIRLTEEVRIIKEKMIQLKDLLKKKAKLDHKLGNLTDLEKLFKGKKFVEFVAATRLKYVSIEASKRLKDITNGNYGLEADENGKFIIRDYKNGGVSRDASTLSGGETFLASLALALALSAEIQLKGTAPLELFFLDEGFGTLDDNLLEVVMSSLERIHNDKLKVGIISHVESIKNRVPVKLILTPAESGRGGSKVKIERS